MRKCFTFELCNKYIRLNHIDLAIGNKVIKKDSKGVITWCDGYNIIIDWLINEEKQNINIPCEQFDKLYDKEFIEILENENITDKPLYKVGDIIEEKDKIYKGIIKESKYNEIEKQFEYRIIVISGSLDEKFEEEILLEKNINVINKLEDEVFYYGNDYKITLEKI